MPVFDTPEPITATLELVLADARITAGERTDTVVEVRPSDPGTDLDVEAAEQTRIGYADGRLLVKAPKQRGLGPFGKPGSIDVEISLPAGSRLHGNASMAAFAVTGRLAECRIKTAIGDLQVDRAGPLDLTTSTGDVLVEAATGPVSASTASGALRIGAIDGDAVVKNSNGDSHIGTVSGDLTITNGNGDILVGHAGADVTAATANGNIRVGEATRGAVSIRSSFGALEVGIPAGTAAYLDLHTQFGNVHNRLDGTAEPAAGDRTVEIRGRTAYGDIVIRRAPGEPS
jgi:Putative adhesin